LSTYEKTIKENETVGNIVETVAANDNDGTVRLILIII
jgi:hypothetical protein